MDLLTPLLTKSISSSIEHNIFPDLAKTGLVVPLDKGKPNKNDILNCQTVSILNTFSKIYDGVIKKNNYFMAWKMFPRHKFLRIEKTIIHSMS